MEVKVMLMPVFVLAINLNYKPIKEQRRVW